MQHSYSTLNGLTVNDQIDNIDITFYPSKHPGAHERHLIRRHENSLFGDRATEVTSDTLQQMQKT